MGYLGWLRWYVGWEGDAEEDVAELRYEVEVKRAERWSERKRRCGKRKEG